MVEALIGGTDKGVLKVYPYNWIYKMQSSDQIHAHSGEITKIRSSPK